MKHLFFGLILLTGCQSVQEYQKAYVNHNQMQLENSALDSFESDFESYREGAAGGNNGNVGSGCGCN